MSAWLHDVDNWVTWADVCAAGGPLAHPELPSPTSPAVDLDPRIHAAMEFAAEWVFLRTGGIYQGPSLWRYDPTPEFLEECRIGPAWAEYRRTGVGGTVALASIELGPGPVREVEEVTLDGTVLAGSGWSLRARRWLIRTGGESWPLPPAGASGWDEHPVVVDYIAGHAVPGPLRRTAAIIARELVLVDFDRGKSRLPTYWRAIQRDGFTVEARAMNAAVRRSGPGTACPAM
jgi:hypothetical protein